MPDQRPLLWQHSQDVQLAARSRQCTAPAYQQGRSDAESFISPAGAPLTGHVHVCLACDTSHTQERVPDLLDSQQGTVLHSRMQPLRTTEK